MKKVLILILIWQYNSTCFPQVLLKGQILKNNSSVYILQPIDGFANRVITRPNFRLYPDRSGKFETKLDIKSPVMITMLIGIRPVWLFVEPNDTISLNINASEFTQNSPKDAIQLGGNNAIGNEFYNKFNYQPVWKINRFRDILDSLNFRKTFDFHAIDYALSKIVHPFDSLLKKGDITNSFYDVVVGDTKGILLTQIIKLAFFERPFSTDSALLFTNHLYQKFPVTDEMLRSGLNHSSIAYYFYYSKARKYFPTYHLDDSLLRVNNKTVFVNKDLVPWLFAPKDICEFEWVYNLVSLNRLFSTVYGQRDVNAFLTVYPNSSMKQYLVPPYYTITDYSTSRNDSSAFIYLKSDTLDSFETLLSNFKEKRLLVDFWATWCMPCRLEFAYNPQVDSFCAKNNIQILYVAFEQSATKKNLKKTVSDYDLAGYHVVANKNLIDDIIKRFYPGGDTYTIPHYLLVNKMGEVVNKNAARPSSANQLFAEMNSAFKLK